jgi:hypothetical protein
MFYTWSIRTSEHSEYKIDVVSRISMFVTFTSIYETLCRLLYQKAHMRISCILVVQLFFSIPNFLRFVGSPIWVF